MIQAAGSNPYVTHARPAAAATATAESNGRTLDISTVPFKVAIEVVGCQEAQLMRALPKGWTTNSAGDCSHGQAQYSGYYIKVISPELKHGQSAQDNIREALETVKKLGGRLGDTGAMKVLIRNGQMDTDCMKELYRMHASVEPIVYQVGQNGTGYHVGHNTINTTPYGFTIQADNPKGNYYFCMPVSNIPDLCGRLNNASSVHAIEQTLAGADRYNYGGKHWGFLPRSPKIDSSFAEFRYFTGTLDPKAVYADVEMVLGMVKCAYEGRWPKDLPNQPLSQHEKKTPVDYRVYGAFMQHVMGGMETASYMEDLFRKAGGRVNTPPVTQQDLGRLKQLQGNGYRLDWGSGKLEGAIAGNASVRITEPGQQQVSYEVPAGEFLAWAAAETEGAAGSPITAMRAAGIKFYAAGEAQPLTSQQGPSILLAQGRLETEFNGNRQAVKDEAALDKVACEALLARQSERVKTAFGLATELESKGYRFTQQGSARLMALANGSELTYRTPDDGPDGAVRTFRGGDFNRWATIVLGRGGELAAEDARIMEQWQALNAAGATLVGAQSPLHELNAGQPLTIQLPGGSPRTFNTAAEASEFMLARVGLLDTLPASGRTALEGLKSAGMQVMAGTVALGSPLQVAWALADQVPNLTLGPANGPTMPVANLDQIRSAVAMDAGNLHELAAADAVKAERLGSLADKDVTFYINGQPTDRKSIQASALDNGTLEVRLPKRIWWGWWWHQSIQPTSVAHLEKITRRL